MIQVRSITKSFRKFCVVDNVFDKSEIEKILDLEDLQTFKKGVIGSTNNNNVVYDPKVRDADVSCVEPDENSKWMYDKIVDLIPKVNYDFFMYSVSGMEKFQYLIYKKDQHYGWHGDSFHNEVCKLDRKISMVAILSEPEEYEGGEFMCIPEGRVDNPIVLKPKAGDVIFFDSTFPHRVCPVTDGIRKSLVTWIYGERHVQFY